MFAVKGLSLLAILSLALILKERYALVITLPRPISRKIGYRYWNSRDGFCN